jgi:serine/threonine protein kinase
VLNLIEKTNENSWFLLVVTEKPEGFGVDEDIYKRKISQQPWSEKELWKIFTELIQIFENYEENALFHGDINPSSIILTPKLALANPGIAYKTPEMHFLDSQNKSPELKFPYFSPEDMDNYAFFCKKSNPRTRDANKSDVYSLGLLFLHMASLEAPLGLNDLGFRLRERIENCVGRLEYSEKVRGLIRRMLEIGESGRPSFKVLANEMKGVGTTLA